MTIEKKILKASNLIKEARKPLYEIGKLLCAAKLEFEKSNKLNVDYTSFYAYCADYLYDYPRKKIDDAMLVYSTFTKLGYTPLEAKVAMGAISQGRLLKYLPTMTKKIIGEENFWEAANGHVNEYEGEMIGAKLSASGTKKFNTIMAQMGMKTLDSGRRSNLSRALEDMVHAVHDQNLVKKAALATTS